MLSPEMLDNKWNLAMYYIAYRIGAIIFDYILGMQDYFMAYIYPIFIQQLRIEGSYTSISYDILTYLAENSPFEQYREYQLNTNTNNLTNRPPSTGRHIFIYRHRIVFANYNKNMTTNGLITESLLLYTYSFDTKFFDNIYIEAQKKRSITKHVYIKHARDGFNPSSGGAQIMWTKRQPIGVTGFSDAIISEDNLKMLIDTLDRFNNPSAREISLKIPRRLVILLSGPPGFGKTTLIKAIAKELDLNIYTASLSSLNDSTIPLIYDNMAKESCLVFEDVDTMTVDRSTQPTMAVGLTSPFTQDSKPVSLSAFLNFLDGINAQEQSIIIMTTNYPEKLDSALIRPERIHLHLKFGPCEDVYRNWTQRFYPDANEVDALNNIVSHSMQRSLSTAALQFIFRRHESIVSAATAIQSL